MALEMARDIYNHYVGINNRISNKSLIKFRKLFEGSNIYFLDSIKAVLEAEYKHLHNDYIRIKTIKELQNKAEKRLRSRYFPFKKAVKRRLDRLEGLLQNEKELSEVVIQMANIIDIGDMLNIAYSKKNVDFLWQI